ncbi:MAG TPA: MinD/ParA family protein [Chthonomonadaceae bacterium]|nr:MinD/ParA family protein [Chthonomonadaceae bacterium]
MSDQAQGLRALADQARHNQSGDTLSAPRVPAMPDDLAPLRDASAPATAFAAVDGRFTFAEGNGAKDLSGPKQTHARVVAVTSGKGGVGKTNFSTNLSLTLAKAGQRVIVLDADLGLANLHVIMGVNPPYNLEHVMYGHRRLCDILHTGPGGVKIIAGGSGITELANLDEPTRLAFVSGMRELDALADVILIDTGAGLSRNVLAFLCAVEEIIVVTTPEPTAITDAYATIKVVSMENPSARLSLVVNMAHSEAEAQAVADRLMLISERFLNVKLEFLGFIPQDPTVSRAVRNQSPFVLSQPTCLAAQGVQRIASQLGYARPAPGPIAGFSGLMNRMQRFFGIKS